MTRIALISEHASPLAIGGGTDSGGQNVYVAHVARQLARAGWHVDVFTRRDDAQQAVVVNWLPRVRVINVPAGPAKEIPKEYLLPLMGEFAQFMEGFIREEVAAGHGYDVLHANFFMSGLVGLHLKRVFDLPLVMTFHALGKVRRIHQGDNDLFPSERFDIEQQIVREADRIIAECPQDRSDLIEHYGADEDRIEVVPCGFDTSEFEPIPQTVARRRLGWDQEEFSILQLGRMVPRKGVDDVVRSLAELKRRSDIRARLYIVGGNTDVADPQATPEIGRLMQLAESIGVLDQVTFTGRRGRKDLALHYSAADVFVTTPWYEPFGITPLEAMACAVPVVGAAVGGIQHTVLHGQTGYLVPAKDPAAIADRLAVLARDPAKRAAMGRAGWARVHRMFTWAKVSHSLAEVYSALIDQAYAQGGRRVQMLSGVGREVSSAVSSMSHMVREAMPSMPNSISTTGLVNAAI